MKTSLRSNGHVFGLLALFTSLTLVTYLQPGAHAFQQAPVFRSRTDLVHLDVSVLDKDRRPVRGLTRDDFVVLEDDKPQTVSIFESIDVPGPVEPTAGWMRDVTPDTTTNETTLSRLWLVVVDDATNSPLTIVQTKALAADVITRLGPEDLATIVFTADSRPAQDFTNDHTQLLVTLKNYNPGWILSPKAKDQFETGNLHTVRNVIDAMIAVPYKRKGLIWISSGPLTGDQAGFIVIPQRAGPNGGMGDAIGKARKVEISKEVFELARRANVPIYPLSPGGIDWIPNDIQKTFAAETGGFAYMNTEEHGPGIGRIFEENSSYYVMGYYPTNTKVDGSLRILKVRVNREGMEVRTRSSYLAPKPGEKPPANTREELIRATAEPVPKPDLPLRATAAPFMIPGKPGLAAVAVALGVTQPIDAPATGSRIPVTTELRVTAFTTEGDRKGMQDEISKVTLRGGRRGDTGYDAFARLDLPPGRFRLRVAAHHEEASRTGTVMVDVIVPDFSKESASMSGVVLTSAPGRPSAPRDLLRDVVPVVPTAQRDFEKFDVVTALFALYQDGSDPVAPAQVAIRITDGHGAVVVNDAQTIPVERFSAPTTSAKTRTPAAAEVRYRVPLDKLPADRYLLTFEATAGAMTLRRDVQFSVK